MGLPLSNGGPRPDRPTGAERGDPVILGTGPSSVDGSPDARETLRMQTPDEAREIYEVIVRLMERFPAASREEVVSVVAAEHEALTGNPIRDFVPVLVEKQAKRRLKLVHAQ